MTQVILHAGEIWFRHHGEEGWIWKSPEDAQRLAEAFETTPKTDKFHTHEHDLASQLRAAIAEQETEHAHVRTDQTA